VARWLLAATLAAAPVLGVVDGREALAQAPPDLTVSSSAGQVEVGEDFAIELKTMGEQGGAQVSSPELVPPREIQVVGQSTGSQMIVDQSSGRAIIKVGVQVVWHMVAQKPGRYVIPGPTVLWNGKKLTGAPVHVEVVAATGRPRTRQPNNPFLMPGGMGGFGFPTPFGANPLPEPEEPHTVAELALPTAPDAQIFIHNVVDKRRVVVGEQISLTTYVYRRIRPPQIISNHDAPLSDFLRMPLAKNPGADQPVYAMVAGTRYVAEQVDQMAIFPLHAGDLHTGAVRFTFGGGTLRTPIERTSEDDVIHVTEPPRAGRPVRYMLGDVGHFTLTADVQPRRIEQGGEVAVKLRLTGTGNLPQSLHLPERTGIEWLDPERKESIEPQGGVIGGWRTLGYVVRIKDSGSIDLGEVTLPYWDPATKHYETTKAILGKIEVSPVVPTPGPQMKDVADAPPLDPFVALPAARAVLGAYVPPPKRHLEGASLWLVIAAPPFLVGALSLGARAARRLAARRATAKESPAALAERALGDARGAEKSGDGKAFAAALERAVHLAVEGATGLRSRGVLLADLAGELEGLGLPEPLAAEVAEALRGCEAIRFDPTPDARTTGDLGDRVRALVADLARRGEGAAA
jgi:hypothetical protein